MSREKSDTGHMSGMEGLTHSIASISFEDEDEDPVIAEYDVYMTPEQPEQSFLIQYPNRDRSKPYGPAGDRPIGMRIKPKSGFLEVDVDTNVNANFDKQKGVKWGEALREATDSGTTSFGMAAGFGKSARSDHLGLSRRPTGDVRQLVERFHQSNEEGRVLNKQTLGGQIIEPGKGKPNYMLGAFRGKELHLTAIDGAVQMRPQFHHLDAQSQAARNKHWRDLDLPRAEPRMIHHQVVKSSTDGDEFNITQTARQLTNAAEESWVTLKFRDEDSEEAYEGYREKLFLSDTSAAPQLKASTADEQYLDSISAPRTDPSGRTKKKPITKKQRLALEEDSDGFVESRAVPSASSIAVPAVPSKGSAPPTTKSKRRGQPKKKTDAE
jgi:DNA-directed RNA polymerase-3 subunit RPC5